MIDFDIALQQLLEGSVCRLKTVRLPLAQAAGRILAEDLNARYPSPMFDNSAMDGYAVCDPDGVLNEFHIIDRIQAGDPAVVCLAAGEAARIFTGAPLPKNTTAVVMQEQTQVSGDKVQVNAEIKAGQNMRLQAEEIQIGQQLLEKGSRLDSAALGLAASQGYAELTVYQPLKVWLVSTGNELAEPGTPLSDGMIYDSNRYQLLAWLLDLGFEVADGGILADNLAQTSEAVAKAAQTYDVIISSGGASVGEADYMKQAVEQSGRLITQTLAIKPGKPFAWGEIDRCAVFILPGNPVAAFVTAHTLLLPALKRLSGSKNTQGLPTVQVCAAFDTRKAIKRREFLRVKLEHSEGQTTAHLLPNQGSAMLATCHTADALCEVPVGQTVTAGMKLTAYLLPKG
ncbi:gephyrin-like molybdotransferase Glp [Neisseria lisongii]|uniref:Molybdopterin molybdenumtransferase n=1 Tax=Neisseria lisongii TaxID=2912188 RepID=A0AAW5AJQ8_9NEIS|nr:gephyrin-like molybdotransferase Glp [Neisseria lisongii]MCF7528695.1 molybdopterin molybdotransferase MoeA [Neisseria lisongii]MCF7529553.1 molybdopterin molybdotransferase MoeA [Neisseria lisongii]